MCVTWCTFTSSIAVTSSRCLDCCSLFDGHKNLVHSWMLLSCQPVKSDNDPNSLDVLLFCSPIFTQCDDVDTALLVHCDPVDSRWLDAMPTLSFCAQMSQHLRCNPKQLRRSKELLHVGNENRRHWSRGPWKRCPGGTQTRRSRRQPPGKPQHSHGT